MDKNSKIVVIEKDIKDTKDIFDDYHIHTNITDGLLSPKEIVMNAKKIGIKNIVITEHIRRISTYDWFKFRDDILDIKPNGINVTVGIETKVLNSKGDLDVSKDVLENVDIILGAVHGVQHVEWLLNSDCDIIAHPQITMDNVYRFLDCNKVLEINYKHPLGDNVICKLVENGNDCRNKNGRIEFSFGSDTHKLEDLRNGQKYFSEINKIYKIKNVKLNKIRK